MSRPSEPSGFSVSTATTSAVGRRSSSSSLSSRYSRSARLSGSSLTTYDTVLGLDQAHDVTMETEDAVHVGEVPVGERSVNGKPAIAGWSEGLAICSRTGLSLARLGRNPQDPSVTGR